MKFVLLFAMLALSGCNVRKTYSEYKIIEFCRDLSGEYYMKEAAGYEYIGPLNNNGINCTRVLFGR